jgi:rsbT co-antagonist protein RsbR
MTKTAEERIEALEQQVADLRARLQFMEEVVEHAPVGIFVRDMEGHYLVVNEKGVKIAGKEQKEEVLGYTPSEIWTEEIIQEVKRANAHIDATHTGTQFEIERPYDGSMHTLLVVNYPVYDEGNDLIAIASIASEITERKRTEQKRYQDAIFLQKLLDTTPGPVFYKNRDGVYLGCNDAFAEQIVGLPKEQIVDHTMFEMSDTIPPDLAAIYHQKDLELIESQGEQRYEAQVSCADGRRRDYHFFKAVYGEAEGIIGVMLDITSQKEVEEQLRTSEERYRAFTKAIPDVLLLISADGIFLDYHTNDPDELFLRPEEFLGKNVRDVFPPELAQKTKENLNEALETRETVVWRYQGIKGKETREFEARYIAAGDNEVLIISRDVTDQHRAEEALRQRLVDEQIIAAQQQVLDEISTPFLELGDHVVLMPLVGAIDTRRAQQMMETLLEGVGRTSANTAILDITGVRVVDTQVAQALVQAAHAVKLLGTRVVVTGIRPDVAQALVHTGADLSGIVTKGSLERGIAYATSRQ